MLANGSVRPDDAGEVVQSDPASPLMLLDLQGDEEKKRSRVGRGWNDVIG